MSFSWLVAGAVLVCPCGAQTIQLPPEGAAYALERGPTLVATLVRAFDGGGATRVRIDRRTAGLAHHVVTIGNFKRHLFAGTIDAAALGVIELQAQIDIVAPGPQGTTAVNARVTTLPSALSVSSIGVELSFVDVAGRQSLLIPTFSGAVFEDPATTIPISRPIDTNSAQCCQATAYYGDDGSGLLMFASDPRGTRPKHLLYSSDSLADERRVVRAAIEFYMPNTNLGGRSAEMPAPVSFWPYSFDPDTTTGWYPAAKRYRGYLERVASGVGGILERGPLSGREDVPSWMKELDLLVSEQFGWYPAKAKVRSPLLSLRRLKEDLGANNVLVGLWFWYDAFSPLGRHGSWLPRFDTVVQMQALKPDGIRFTGYTYPGAFDAKNPLLTAFGLDQHTIEDRAGVVDFELGALDVFGERTKFVHMDVASPSVSEWYWVLGAFHSLHSGLSGFYSDLPMAVRRPDFARPGGNVGVTESAYRGYGEILRRSQEGARLVGQDFVQYHEAAFEWLIGSASAQGAVGVVGRAYPGQSKTRGVPFFQTVFSGYTLFWPADEGFGPQTLIFVPEAYGDMNESNMTRMLAEGFTWGMIPNNSELGLAEGKLNYELETEEPYTSAFAHHRDVLRRLIALRRAARPWLVYGELLDSPVSGADMRVMTVKQLIDNRFGDESYEKPVVPATAWEAADGTKRLVAANGSRIAGNVELDLARIGLARSAWVLRDVETLEVFPPGAGGTIEVGVASGMARLLQPIRR